MKHRSPENIAESGLPYAASAGEVERLNERFLRKGVKLQDAGGGGHVLTGRLWPVTGAMQVSPLE